LTIHDQVRELLGRAGDAALRYAGAIGAAEEAGFHHDLATVHERAALFHDEQGHAAPALFHRTQARDLYRRWEAWAKAADLERRHPALAPPPDPPRFRPSERLSSSSSGRLAAGALDIEAVLKAAQAISGEIRRDGLVDRLLRTVFEAAGAERGHLLLADADGRLVPAAEGDMRAGVFRALPTPDTAAAREDGPPPVPAAVAAYTARLNAPLVLDDAAADPRFADDPTIRARRPRSVLCLPLVRQGVLIGLLYLENNLVTGAFVDQRVEVPCLLAAQIAISLENARLYDELAAFNRSLEAQVAERTRALDGQSSLLRRTLEEVSEAHARLQETQRQLVQAEKMAALGELVAGVSHEINTPLGVALTAASHLSDETARIVARFEAGGLRRAEFQGYAEAAVESTGLLMANLGRAADLVRGFKQVAVDQTSGERRVFELDSWLDALVLSLRPMWHRAKHEVSVTGAAGIVLDSHPGALAQVLTNLISNALVHGLGPERAGRIAIAVTQPDPDSVEIAVADDGRGIAPDALPFIFDPFFTTRRSQGSTGLGLHIVYNLVTQALGGSVTAASPPGGGARFTLRIPKVAPEAPPSPPA
ncbi:sensor histidine kinase, partial [Azospirillum isscasi]